MVAEFSLICYKDMGESINNANAKGQTVLYHDRLGNRNVILTELGTDEQRN